MEISIIVPVLYGWGCLCYDDTALWSNNGLRLSCNVVINLLSLHIFFVNAKYEHKSLGKAFLMATHE